MGIKPPTPQELAAKQAITEVIHRFSRGMDRMDRPMAEDCFHPGATDDHGPFFAGTAEGFLDYVWPAHEQMVSTRHAICNILIDLDGDQAGAESYYQVTSRVRRDSGLVDTVSCGRYLDRLACVDGAWAFTHRSIVRDWFRSAAVTPEDAAVSTSSKPDGPAPQISARDRSDASYGFVGGL